MKLFAVVVLIFVFASISFANEIFIDNGDGTVTDKESGLMWQNDLAWFPNYGCGGPSTYCKELNLGKYNDWLLPDSIVLKNLYKNKHNFPEKITGEYWASDFVSAYMQSYIDFDSGSVSSQYCRDTLKKVRCVRVLGITNNTEIPVQTLAEWVKYGFKISDIESWLEETGFPRCKGFAYNGITPESAYNWKKMGFSTEDACDWSWTAPEKAKIWRDLQFNSKEASSWSDFSTTEAAQWKEASITKTDARNWINNGFSPIEGREWFKLEFSAAEAKKWKYEGFNFNDASEWQQVFSNPREASKWKRYDFAAKEAKIWNKSKFTPENALQWKNEGKSPEESIKWIGYKPETAKKLEVFCKNGIGSFFEVATINPYDTNGKCYKIQGQVLQLLNRSQALYHLQGFIFFVDFKKESATANIFNGHVIGRDAYKYIDTTGAQRIVPSFDIISF